MQPPENLSSEAKNAQTCAKFPDLCYRVFLMYLFGEIATRGDSLIFCFSHGCLGFIRKLSGKYAEFHYIYPLYRTKLAKILCASLDCFIFSLITYMMSDIS